MLYGTLTRITAWRYPHLVVPASATRPAQEEPGIQARPFEEALRDTVQWLVERVVERGRVTWCYRISAPSS